MPKQFSSIRRCLMGATAPQRFPVRSSRLACGPQLVGDSPPVRDSRRGHKQLTSSHFDLAAGTGGLRHRWKACEVSTWSSGMPLRHVEGVWAFYGMNQPGVSTSFRNSIQRMLSIASCALGLLKGIRQKMQTWRGRLRLLTIRADRTWRVPTT